MPKPKALYEIECDSPPNHWTIYKTEDGIPESKVGYDVELHKYGEGGHNCTCPFGSHTKEGEGQKLKQCKHVKMVTDFNKAWNELIEEGLVSDNAIGMNDLSANEKKLILSKMNL